MKEKMIALIISELIVLNNHAKLDLPVVISSDTALFGQSGLLDSIALVSLIVNIEQRIETEYGLSLTLASEKAFSRRNSPFLSVNHLALFIESLIPEKK